MTALAKIGEAQNSTPTATTYTISTTVNNGTSSGATSIAQNGTATVTITANTNYTLPSTITVTGATQSYNSETGVISLSNPTEQIIILATCSEVQTSARASITPAPTGSTYTEGQQVTIGEEKFFVLSDDGTTVKLLAKYCLNHEGTAQENSVVDSSGTGRRFSKTNYWSNDFTNGLYDLQSSSMITAAEGDGEVETGIPNAVIAAKNYGTSKGGNGRLMTYAEANRIKNGTDSTMKNILFGKWTGSDVPVSGYLKFWLSRSSSRSGVWQVSGNTKDLVGLGYTATNVSVRPVIEIH